MKRPCSCDAFGVMHVFTEGVCDPDYIGPPKPFPVSISEPDDPSVMDLLEAKFE